MSAGFSPLRIERNLGSFERNIQKSGQIGSGFRSNVLHHMIGDRSSGLKDFRFHFLYL